MTDLSAAAITDPRTISSRFEGPIEPVPVTVGYRVALVLVALAMIVLPVAYLALVGLAGWGVYLWVVYTVEIWPRLSGSLVVRLLLFGTPLVTGVILVLFLIKPLFAPRARGERPLRLERREQPLLFEVVDRLCAMLGARRPREIRVDCEVNASAGLRRGLVSLAGNDLVLTIGLPLASGLTVEQLAAVLAHEFGHFAQRAAMGFSFVIRTVNHWFLRVVYQRDAWDQWLEKSTRHGDLRIRMVMAVARGGVWLSRHVLRLLMVSGHSLSCRLMRHMEFDADRYAARLAGSKVAASTHPEMFALTVGQQQGRERLEQAWREGRLGDNVPALAVAHRRELAEPILRAYKEHLATARTGRWDTHPAIPQRLAALHREGAAGRFACDLPAAVLFRDLEGLERKATLHFYRAVIGEGHQVHQRLVPSADLVSEGNRHQSERQAAERVFRGVPSLGRPLPLTRPEPATDLDELALARRLGGARATAEAAAAELSAAASRDRPFDALRRAWAAGALLRAGRQGDPAAFRLTDWSIAAADRSAVEASAVLADPGVSSRAFLDAAAERIGAALALRALREPEASAEDRRLLATAALIAETRRELDELHRALVVLDTLWGQVAGETREPALVEQIRTESLRCLHALEALHRQLRGQPYPFPHAREGLDLADHILPDVPDASQLHPTLQVANATLAELDALYARLLGALAIRVERAEESLVAPAAAPAAAPLTEPTATGASG